MYEGPGRYCMSGKWVTLGFTVAWVVSIVLGLSLTGSDGTNSVALMLSCCFEHVFSKYEFIPSETFDFDLPPTPLCDFITLSFAISSAIWFSSTSCSLLLRSFNSSSSNACFSFNAFCFAAKIAIFASVFKRADEREDEDEEWCERDFLVAFEMLSQGCSSSWGSFTVATGTGGSTSDKSLLFSTGICSSLFISFVGCSKVVWSGNSFEFSCGFSFIHFSTCSLNASL